jgi:hypothetical protein
MAASCSEEDNDVLHRNLDTKDRTELEFTLVIE